MKELLSFKVNTKINRRYDHWIGIGGSIIAFGILYYGCTLTEFINKLDDDFSFHRPMIYASKESEAIHKITVLEAFPISSFALIKYLGQRKIPLLR